MRGVVEQISNLFSFFQTRYEISILVVVAWRSTRRKKRKKDRIQLWTPQLLHSKARI